MLQNADHARVDDMAAVISAIVNDYRVAHRGALPDWNRKNVMQEISERVTSNEQDLRPWGGGRPACPDWPAPPGRPRSTSRPSRRIGLTLSTPSPPGTSRGSGPATSGSGAGGRPRPAGRLTNRPICPEPGSTRALAKDPVWKSVAARREKKGPNRPENDEERAALGTRAELKSVDPYADAF